MRRSLFTDSEIRFFLAEADRGVSVEEICRTADVSIRTFYRWRRQFGVSEPELDRLRVLERENHLLRKELRKRDAGSVDVISRKERSSKKARVRVDCGAGTTFAPDLIEREARPPAADATGANIGRFPSIRTGR